MSEAFVQIGFKDCPIRRGGKTHHYSGVAKVRSVGPDYVGQVFTVAALQPDGLFIDDDFEVVERFLEKKALAEILGLLKRADSAAGN